MSQMTSAEAVAILERHLRLCGMLMPIEWVKGNGDGSDFQIAYGMALDALREKRDANG